MPRICNRVALPGGGVAIITTSTSINPNDPCGFCLPSPDGRVPKHVRLCDFPIRKGKDTKRYTCTRRLCADHAIAYGDGKLDFCPIHAMLVDRHGLADQLVALCTSDMHAHRVALDLIDTAIVTSAPAVRYVPKGLADWREFVTERAAIFEYDGGYPRGVAERMALALAGERPKPSDMRSGR